MIVQDIRALQKFLEGEGILTELQKDTNQLYLNFKSGEIEFPAFLRLYDGKDLLQLLVFIPVSYKQGSAPDVARLLHLINKELDCPGFGLDEESSLIFYRQMVILDKGINQTIVLKGIKSLEAVAIGFASVINAVASGAASFRDVLEKTAAVKAAATSKE